MLYIIIRTLNVGVTYDECWTMNDFVNQSVLHIINFTPCDANNHIVNTLLIKLLFSLGNHSIYVARLPNVLAFIFYLYFSYLIANRFITGTIGFATFLLLLLNPFLLDFFGLARGYGIALAFEMGSIYYLIRFIRTKQTRYVLIALIAGAFAVLSNLALLNFWVSILWIIFLVSLAHNGFNFKKILISGIVCTAVLAAILYEPIRKLSEHKNLFYGGNNGFYSDTLVSLTKYTCYTPHVSSITYCLLNLFIIIFLVLVGVSCYFQHALLSDKNILLLILLSAIFATIVQHYFIGTLYLIDRTALFFYPLIILVLCYSVREFPLLFYGQIVLYFMVLCFGINFFNKANFYKTAVWYYDAHTKNILNLINEEGRKKGVKKSLDFSWPFQCSVKYYLAEKEYPFIENHQKDMWDFEPNADYYIYLGDSLEKVGYTPRRKNIIGKDTVLTYPNESVFLLRDTASK